MKNLFKTLFDIHSIIGKICTAFCVSAIVVALIGLPFGLTKCSKNNEVVETNYFLYEIIPLHDSNYNVIINNVSSFNNITILNKKNTEKNISGNFIGIDIQITQNANSNLKPHKFDTNDFKIKNHTGVYVPLNDIMEPIGWDGIDVHIDDKEGGHVMSSANFSTTNCIKDFNYINKSISSGKTIDITLYFKLPTDIIYESNLIVLELDFYNTSFKYKKGTDIILLPRPENLKTA